MTGCELWSGQNMSTVFSHLILTWHTLLITAPSRLPQPTSGPTLLRNALHSSPQFPLPSLISPLPWNCEKSEREQEQGSGFGSDQTRSVCVCACVFGSCVRTGSPVSTSVCEVQLKSNSFEQVFVSNDLSLLSISLLTTSCRGRDGQGQTRPRQMERHIKRQEEREQGGRREKSTWGKAPTIKHQKGMRERGEKKKKKEGRKTAESPYPNTFIRRTWREVVNHDIHGVLHSICCCADEASTPVRTEHSWNLRCLRVTLKILTEVMLNNEVRHNDRRKSRLSFSYRYDEALTGFLLYFTVYKVALTQLQGHQRHDCGSRLFILAH